jgi:hypothetical protein
MNLILISIIVLILNIPFGYWRANVKRFSLQWFLAIHLPVPVIIFLRLISGTGFDINSFVVLVIAYFLGQITGLTIFNRMKLISAAPLTSCLVMDIYRSRHFSK